MENWRGWRKRAKEVKKDTKIGDADIAAIMSETRNKNVERSTVNSWFNKREPNLSDFMEMCEAMGADPGLILFGQAVLRNAVPADSSAQSVLRASPTATPNHKKFVATLKVRKFKQKRKALRRVLVR